MQCQICKKHFKHLGSHIWHAHKILARDYKMEFGLDLKYPLIDEEVKIKKQVAFAERREFYLKNLSKGGKKYRFKKGQVPARTYFSKQSMDRAEANLKKMNHREPLNCPICNMRTKHLPSHLYNAHGLLMVSDKLLYQKNKLSTLTKKSNGCIIKI